MWAETGEDPYHYYLPEMNGKFGIESHFDEQLRGVAGGQLVRVDVAGYRRDDPDLDRFTREPSVGSDLQLTLDLRIQRLAEEALGGMPGAVVVLDPNTGDILALASAPRFDPNEFVPFIPTARWRALLGDPQRPLFDRAVSGSYPPGSTFKPLVAIAAMENADVPSSTRMDCSGTITLGNISFGCARGIAHGDIDLREALCRSCNVYFYKLGLRVGYDYIYHLSAALGLGQPFRIGLDHERSGLLPSDAWMRQTMGHGWRQGDTVNASIGQGALTVTPLQMAQVCAVIATGGKAHRPRLVRARRAGRDAPFEPEPPELLADMRWSRATMAQVHGGMRDAVMTPQGTGHRARVPGVEFAGKTGTAQYGPRDQRKYRGWMISFAPLDRPRYAIAVVIDEADSGGLAAGPVVRHIVAGLLATPGTEGGRG